MGEIGVLSASEELDREKVIADVVTKGVFPCRRLDIQALEEGPRKVLVTRLAELYYEFYQKGEVAEVQHVSEVQEHEDIYELAGISLDHEVKHRGKPESLQREKGIDVSFLSSSQHLFRVRDTGGQLMWFQYDPAQRLIVPLGKNVFSRAHGEEVDASAYAPLNYPVESLVQQAGAREILSGRDPERFRQDILEWAQLHYRMRSPEEFRLFLVDAGMVGSTGPVVRIVFADGQRSPEVFNCSHLPFCNGAGMAMPLMRQMAQMAHEFEQNDQSILTRLFSLTKHFGGKALKRVGLM